MIKATDLRIGNFFSYHGVNVFVMKISEKYAEFGYLKDSIGFDRFYEYEKNDFPDPIPLSEGWLLKFGFNDKDYKSGFIGIDVNHTNFVLTKPGGQYDFKYYSWEYKNDIWPKYNEFKYVHELQNFFWALTGEELKFKTV